MWSSNSIALIALFLLCSLRFIECQDTTLDEFFLKASNNIPRIGRSGNNKGSNDDFENFFLKASKSVPRIGRRNEVDTFAEYTLSVDSMNPTDPDFVINNNMCLLKKPPGIVDKRQFLLKTITQIVQKIQQGRPIEESLNSYIYTEKSDIEPNMRKYPTWSEIAKMYENEHQGLVTDGMNSNKLSNGNYEDIQNEKEYGRSKRTTNYV